MIKQQDEELNKISEEINKIKDEWLPSLNALVDKINSNFSNYFTKMKCAGEVSLIHSDNPVSYSDVNR